MRPIFFSLFFVLLTFFSYSQNSSQIREYKSIYNTYPFSDPNPIPVFGKIYPYYRYDGFTEKAEKKSWKIVELENDFLKIKIFPEIGGKIWSVIDKTNGKELFYDNDVVKFRDISLRGPWTSGGIEFNYGVVGHAPSCSFPVDYMTQVNDDGSASCFIGVLDLLTRTRWTVEINLPKDKGWFTTSSFWHNSTSGTQPYYNWVNTGVLAKEDLEFIYPGKHNIRHDGIALSWPMDSLRNKNLSRWIENDFIGSKSYHIMGTHNPYFGAYWTSEDFGMMRYANRDEKLGRKIFSWALSDQGDIWKELLTDNKGQYVELQSGRLFNQNMVISSLTPFKQIGFMPYATDRWNEYWFPYKGTKGVSNVNLNGVIHVSQNEGLFSFNLYPLQTITDTLKFYNKEGKELFKQQVSLEISKTYEFQSSTLKDESVHSVRLANQTLWTNDNIDLQRPADKNDQFNWNTAQGQYLRGRDLSGLRLYDEAEIFIRQSLEYDPYFIPSLTEMSRLCYYKMDYDSAFYYAYQALSIDTYDAAANFEYGKAALKQKKYYDALDGFEVAALSTPYRSAAYTELSRIYTLKKEYDKAIEYAEKSLINNRYNIESLQLLYLLHKIKGDKDQAIRFGELIQSTDPLNHFIEFEKYLQDKTSLSRKIFQENIKCEMPEEIYLELGIWYNSLGQKERALEVFNIAPPHPEIQYWIAFLKKDMDVLVKAEKLDANLIFPFRDESEQVFKWANENGSKWKASYYLSLLHAFRNNREKVIQLLESVEDKPDFAPFYILRSQYITKKAEKDLQRAISLTPDEWRYVDELTRFYLSKSENLKALNVITPFYKKNRNHFPTATLYTRTLIRNKQYQDAEKVLADIHILPFEGARDGRLLYQETKLMLAADALNAGNLKLASKKIEEAYLWPRNLGVGKPYDDVIDTRIEDWLNAILHIQSSNSEMKTRDFEKVAHSTLSPNSINTLLQCIALYQLGETQKSEQLFLQWRSNQKAENMQQWGESFYKENREKENPFDYQRTIRIIGLISGTEDSRLF
jgi:tetratricopeptide (TPR) repeat protein